MSLTEFAAESGKTVEAPATTPTAPAALVSYGSIDLDLIVTSPTNPRTSHGPTKLQQLLDDAKKSKQVRELVAAPSEEARKSLIEILGSEKLAEFVLSIGAHGVNQPALLRPLPASRLADTANVPKGKRRPEFEIIAGERRYFGSRLAGKTQLPAMIKHMDDQEVLAFQLVENLQRDDLHPMEEAEGYERLVRETGLRKEDIGAKIGKSRGYVYGRLKLLDLGTEARQAFYDGKVDFSRALLIARIPDPKLQIKAVEEATGDEYNDAPSVREFQQWLHQNVMLRLDQAGFDIKSESLVAKAGSCVACPKRTGANPDLFADVKSADVCTDPKCFDGKKEAHYAQIAKQAEAKGQKVILGKEAKELMPNQYSAPKGFMRLDAQEYIDGVGYTSLRKAVGKADLPTPVLFQNPHTKQLEEMLPTSVANKLLKDVTGAKKEKAAAKAKGPEPKTFEELWQEAAVRAVFAEILAGKLQHLTSEVGRTLAQDQINRFSHDGDALMADLLSVGDQKVGTSHAIEVAINEAPPEMIGPILMLSVMLGEICDDPFGPKPPTLYHLAERVGVDVEAIKREIKADMPAPVGKGQNPGKAERQGAFMKPLQPSAELAAITGSEPQPRTEIVSKVWTYIKKHKLQDGINKRMVNADAPLQAVFGKPQISMFEMATILGKHVSSVRATTPAAQAKGEPEGKPGAKAAAGGGKKAAGKAAARQSKLSAEVAKQGIANAMQKVEPASAVGSPLQPQPAWPFPTKPASAS
jgi:ParB/RepB/Spo0J family partition protein